MSPFFFIFSIAFPSVLYLSHTMLYFDHTTPILPLIILRATVYTLPTSNFVSYLFAFIFR